jgi:hypothetical protein
MHAAEGCPLSGLFGYPGTLPHWSPELVSRPTRVYSDRLCAWLKLKIVRQVIMVLASVRTPTPPLILRVRLCRCRLKMIPTQAYTVIWVGVLCGQILVTVELGYDGNLL